MIFEGDNTVLVVGAHPDDEVLGAGGAIAKHAVAGDEVHVLIVTEGVTQQYDDTDFIGVKKDEARECAKLLGAEEIHFGDLPDMQLNDTEHVKINRVIEDTLASLKPDIVYTHSRKEMNRDHIEVHDATLVAARPPSEISSILAYEVLSSTDFYTGSNGFSPDLFIDIEKHLDTKIDAFKCYQTEIREYPHPRSVQAIDAMATVRGVASGVRAAEAFEIARAYR